MSVRSLYLKARKAGYPASQAYHAAKIVHEFNQRDDVRIRCEDEQSSYFDVYGEPEGYTDIYGRWHSPEQERKEIEDRIERLGLWVVYSEALDPQTGEFEMVDSVGMNEGYRDPCDWLENCYVPQLMQAAIEYAEQFDSEPVWTDVCA